MNDLSGSPVAVTGPASPAPVLSPDGTRVPSPDAPSVPFSSPESRGDTIEQKEALIAVLQAEIVALKKPAPQYYPKAVYFKEPGGALRTHVVQTHVEHEALGAGWHESPVDAKAAAVSPDLSKDDAAIAADQRALDAAHAQRAADAAQR